MLCVYLRIDGMQEELQCRKSNLICGVTRLSVKSEITILEYLYLLM